MKRHFVQQAWKKWHPVFVKEYLVQSDKTLYGQKGHMFLEQYFHLFFGHILLLGHSFLSDKYSHFQLSIYFYRNETSNNQSMYELADSELPLYKTHVGGLLLLHKALDTRVNNRIFLK